jgi:putative FmdB family regulatory protein
MPIYEYECRGCSTVFEIFQRMAEEPLLTCPDCSGPVKKLVSMSSFKLKGGGWYADGYSSKAVNGGAPSADGSPAKKSDTKTTEADKPATKSTDTSPKAVTGEKSCSTAA